VKKSFLPLNTRSPYIQFLAQNLSSHNLPTDRARELLKPSKEAGSRIASILKNLGLLGLNFFGVTRGVLRLDGARGKKQVWRPHVRN